MKVELTFENGYARLNIAPQNEFEERMLACLAEKPLETHAKITRDCYRKVECLGIDIVETCAKQAEPTQVIR